MKTTQLRWSVRMKILLRRFRGAGSSQIGESLFLAGDPGSPNDTSTEPPPELNRWLRYIRILMSPPRRGDGGYMVATLIVISVAVISMINHFGGVDWGDDFALYMRQAEAVVSGTTADVIEDNRFAVDNSGWHTFSHYAYPWGWPLIMAPFSALLGRNYEVFKLLEVIALCVFLLLFFTTVRRRAGPLPATVLTLLIGLSPAYVSATDTVLSDVPYLCFVGLSLWWMDRCRSRGLMDAAYKDLAVLGLLLAITANIRFEGVALVFALIALHIATATGNDRRRDGRSRQRSRWRAMVPYATLGLGVAALQLLLSGPVLPNAPGTGIRNIPARATFYKDIIAEHVGLKDPGVPMQLFDSHDAAYAVVIALMVLGIIGLVGRLVHGFEEDLTLAVYLCCVSLVMLISPYEAGRFLLTITPLLAYFAYQALPTLATLIWSRRRLIVPLTSLVPALVFSGLVALNARDIAHSTDYHLDYSFTVYGPETPNAQEMFSVVRSTTDPDDVILFFRARAMTLYTDRRAIQGSDLNLMFERADWYVMEKGSTYSQTLLTDAEAAAYALEKSWENPQWVLWRVPD